ncbi:DNA mismatch repair protein MutS [Planctomycetaceae bacterium]|jgi:DNA mismatch repair protein MutS|nr:DNA mismatch repair protein MutS [Planctomycetaceae bacterium]
MPNKSQKLTPMMERYLEVKRENPGTVLLFRMGDFYELFNEDAKDAAKILGLTLTSRDKKSDNPIPMAGFPYHSLENYLQKLIRAGRRAAVCEQVEDPKQAKGLVKREVTRIVTPGTLTDDSLLDPRSENLLAALSPGKEQLGLAWLELSTGKFQAATVGPENLADELARLSPSELLIPEKMKEDLLGSSEYSTNTILITERPAWCYSHNECRRTLKEHFKAATLEGFDIEEESPATTAAGVLLEYVQETQKTSLSHITRITPYRRGHNLIIDEATRRSLELTSTIREGTRDNSLLDVIDQTVTSMGARLLGDWLTNPLTDLNQINQRLDAVGEIITNLTLMQDVRELLDDAYDLQRLTARCATRRVSPKDLSFLAKTLSILPALKAKMTGRSSALLQEIESRFDLCADVRSDIDKNLADDPPLLVSDGGMIRSGVNAELDEFRTLSKGGKEWIASYQAQQSETTGIPNLKVGFNKVFGYYLEVTAAHQSKVPDHFIRKQTLKNQERYITPELKEYEEKVLQAEERAITLEQQLYDELRERVAEQVERLQNTAELLAITDVLMGLAHLANQKGYCRPEMTVDSALDIREGRHPVLDHILDAGEFVPNDTRLGGPTGFLQIITGPNMAGKSTYIRQSALLTILAQMGSYVPASEARIGIADRIFARVGASDELGKGHSTFMVEMTETARILNAATDRSLVILDEIGRGTSTYDGISLAWAVTEYIHDVIKARTLFATHYHELTDLTQTLKQATNWNVAVREQESDVIFLHKIVEGTADKSYGIHVARLAGVPQQVLDRAGVILESLEEDHLDERGKPKVPVRDTHKQNRQLSLFESEPHPVVDELQKLDINQLTPLDALQKLYLLQEKVQSKKS